jgi:ribonuclease HII
MIVQRFVCVVVFILLRIQVRRTCGVVGIMVPALRRRSPRLAAAAAAISRTASTSSSHDSIEEESKLLHSTSKDSTRTAQKKSTTTTSKSATSKSATNQKRKTSPNGLARTLEFERRKQYNDNKSNFKVMGIDEAGRGPLAGPVVAAAVIMNDLGDNHAHLPPVDGIHDSKKIAKEEERENLYQQIVMEKSQHWAIAVIDAAKIDEINILQATLLGMQLAARAVMGRRFLPDDIPVHDHVSSQHAGCYIVVPPEKNPGHLQGGNEGDCSTNDNGGDGDKNNNNFFALIDGNRVPSEMPCPSEAVIRGDATEYCIAAASILAKVSRDRIMKEYDAQFPEYQLGQNKGYPTAVHMRLVHVHGACPIHRRSFAPLKFMKFDPETGKVIADDSR